MKKIWMRWIATGVIFCSSSTWAGPTLMVLSYEVKNNTERHFQKTETLKMTDRLRDELRRRFGPAVYNKQETDFLFSYFNSSSFNPVTGGQSFAEHLEKAKAAYFNLDFDEAKKHLDPLVKEGSEDVIVEANLLRGLVAFAENDSEEARQSFLEARRLDSHRVLEKRYFPPKVIQFYEKVSQSPLQTVALKIDTNPVGTEVWLNGVLLGLAPQTFQVPAGKHWLSLRANHYQTIQKRIHLKEDLSLQERLSWIGRSSRETSLAALKMGADQDIWVDQLAKLGAQMNAADVVLFSVVENKKHTVIETRIVDTKLRTAHKLHEYVIPETMSLEKNSSEISSNLIDQLQERLAINLKIDPAQFVENRFRGDIVLVGYHRKYFFESPWFWGLLGAAGLGLGLGIGLTAGSSATTGVLGVTFQ